jgi:hypothetical protein
MYSSASLREHTPELAINLLSLTSPVIDGVNVSLSIFSSTTFGALFLKGLSPLAANDLSAPFLPKGFLSSLLPNGFSLLPNGFSDFLNGLSPLLKGLSPLVKGLSLLPNGLSLLANLPSPLFEALFAPKGFSSFLPKGLSLPNGFSLLPNGLSPLFAKGFFSFFPH